MFPTNYNPGFDLGNCLALADWTGAAYEDQSTIRSLAYATQADGLDFFQGVITDAQGFVVWKGDDAVISFRGSASIRNWILDARFVRRSWNCRQVHSGFADGFDSIEGKLTQILTGARVQRVWVTGHSLGGALAALCADWLPWHLGEFAGGVTFGEPRGFDRASAGLIEAKLGKKFIRVVHESDIVTRLPGVLLNFRHFGQEAFLNSFGQLQVNPSLVTKLESDGFELTKALLVQHRQASRLAAIDQIVTDHLWGNYRGRLFPAKGVL